MSDTSSLMAVSQATSAVNTGVGAYNSSEAAIAEGNYQKQMAQIKSKLANMQAEAATKRGEKEAQLKMNQAKQAASRQRAMAAGQGVAVDAGSVGDLQADTLSLGAIDAMTIKNNAYREAFGYKSEAINYQSQADFAELSAQNKSRNSLVTGGLGVISGTMQSIYYGSGGADAAPKKPTGKVKVK